MPRRLVPPVYLLLSLGLMAMLHACLPWGRVVGEPLRRAGLPLVGAGVLLVLHVAWKFRRAGTTIRPFRDSSVLVTDGPFRWSRNPIYVGMTIVLTGVGLLLGSLPPFLVIPVFVVAIDRLFVRAEEAALENRFGESYRAYAARVRRWI